MNYLQEEESSWQERSKLDAQRQRASLEYVMNDVRGRHFIQWLLEISGVGRQSFVQDSLSNAFNEGKRAIGIALLDRLKNPHHFDQYITLLKEHGSHE